MSDTTYKWRMDDGGWGVAPFDPNFAVSGGNMQATLSWELQDTVIDGQKICTVAGVVIRRSTERYPKNELDGDLVIKSTDMEGTYTDTGLTNGTTYYYKAFPYSDHNIYGRDNYHAKGSVTPSEAAHIIINFPSAVNGETVTAKKGDVEETATVAGDHANIAVYETGTWDVCGIDVEVNALGESVTTDGTVFAFHYSEGDSDPASADYPAGYDNYGWTPFAMNLSTGVPNYGSWDPAGINADKLAWFYPKSCMLKYDGTVAYYLDENDETKKADGTASDVANTAFDGNAMIEWGQAGRRHYWKLMPDSGNDGFTFIIANAEVLGCKPWNHYDENGNVNRHFYEAKYFGSNISSKLRSISGQSNFVSNAGTTEITYALANNPTGMHIWETGVYIDTTHFGLCCYLIGKSLNVQTTIGTGRTASGNSSAIGQGTMNGKGMFYGKSDGTEGVKAFGVENPWGNLYRRIRGLVAVNSTYKVKLTYDTTDGSEATGYNTDGTGYISAGNLGTYGSWVYPKHMLVRENTLLAGLTGGSETTYYCDGTYITASGTFYALVGGYWSYAGRDGAFYVNLSNAVSDTDPSIGAALSCKPLAEAA